MKWDYDEWNDSNKTIADNNLNNANHQPTYTVLWNVFQCHLLENLDKRRFTLDETKVVLRIITVSQFILEEGNTTLHKPKHYTLMTFCVRMFNIYLKNSQRCNAKSHTVCPVCALSALGAFYK